MAERPPAENAIGSIQAGEGKIQASLRVARGGSGVCPVRQARCCLCEVAPATARGVRRRPHGEAEGAMRQRTGTYAAYVVQRVAVKSSIINCGTQVEGGARV